MVTDLYVGHTTDFKIRQYKHKSNCNNEKKKEYNYLIYKTIRDKGGWNNWSMIEVEHFPCDDVYQAIAREGFWYKELNGTLNKHVPSQTDKEYNRQYRQTNKEQILEKAKAKIECECGSCFRKDSKARHLKTAKHLNF
jgi:fatty-acid desaturase